MEFKPVNLKQQDSLSSCQKLTPVITSQITVLFLIWFFINGSVPKPSELYRELPSKAASWPECKLVSGWFGVISGHQQWHGLWICSLVRRDVPAEAWHWSLCLCNTGGTVSFPGCYNRNVITLNEDDKHVSSSLLLSLFKRQKCKKWWVVCSSLWMYWCTGSTGWLINWFINKNKKNLSVINYIYRKGQII